MDGDLWTDAKNVLCVRLDALGDVLLTTPAIRAVKESGADRRVTLLTSPAGAEAAALAPEIDVVLRYSAPWMRTTGVRADRAADLALIETLRARRFDAAVIFTCYSQSPLPAALLCYLAEIPLRAARCRENPYHLLTDWLSEDEPQTLVRHEVRRQLDLAAAIGCRPSSERLSLAAPPQADREILRLLKACGVDCDRPWAAIHPGASAPSRRYPPEHFVEVADGLVEAGLQVVFTGTASESALIEGIRKEMQFPSHSLAGRLDLGRLAALFARTAIVISNNTGPAHVAAAAGAPVVDLYALTNPQHAPWQTPHRVLFSDVSCKYCYKSVCPAGHHDCLRRVTPQAVLEATWELLDGLRAARAAELTLETAMVGGQACIP